MQHVLNSGFLPSPSFSPPFFLLLTWQLQDPAALLQRGCHFLAARLFGTHLRAAVTLLECQMLRLQQLSGLSGCGTCDFLPLSLWFFWNTAFYRLRIKPWQQIASWGRCTGLLFASKVDGVLIYFSFWYPIQSASGVPIAESESLTQSSGL